MGFFVCWFLAEADDAAAIRSIATSGERKREEWPHLVLPGVDGPDLNVLEKRARPKRAKSESRIGGKLLGRSKMTDTPFTAVSQVSPEFVQHLAALDAVALGELARSWARAVEGVAEEAAIKLVQEMAAFAQRAEQAGKPVLQLDLM
jgi:hypothetical protein